MRKTQGYEMLSAWAQGAFLAPGLRGPGSKPGSFRISDFGFLSDFGLRISALQKSAVRARDPAAYCWLGQSGRRVCPDAAQRGFSRRRAFGRTLAGGLELRKEVQCAPGARGAGSWTGAP